MKKLLFLTASLLPALSGAYEPRQVHAQELAECASFFSLNAVAIEKNDVASVDTYILKSTQATELSEIFSNKQVANVRIKTALNKQMELMDNNFSNISVLREKYLNNCVVAVANARERMAAQ